MESNGPRGRDRRRSARHEVHDVTGTLHFSAEARIMNMSLTGMAVETDAQLRLGRMYSLTLRHGDEPALRLSGKVVWCHLRTLKKSGGSEPRPVYEAGVQFDEALTETASELARILRSTAVIAVEKRISGRFAVDLAEPVSLNTSHSFNVKTISTVGILVETDAAVPVDSVIDFELHLGDTGLRARGRIAYATEAAGGDGAKVHRLGVEFLEMPPDGRALIEGFIGRSIADAGGVVRA